MNKSESDKGVPKINIMDCYPSRMLDEDTFEAQKANKNSVNNNQNLNGNYYADQNNNYLYNQNMNENNIQNNMPNLANMLGQITGGGFGNLLQQLLTSIGVNGNGTSSLLSNGGGASLMSLMKNFIGTNSVSTTSTKDIKNNDDKKISDYKKIEKDE